MSRDRKEQIGERVFSRPMECATKTKVKSRRHAQVSTKRNFKMK